MIYPTYLLQFEILASLLLKEINKTELMNEECTSIWPSFNEHKSMAKHTLIGMALKHTVIKNYHSFTFLFSFSLVI